MREREERGERRLRDLDSDQQSLALGRHKLLALVHFSLLRLPRRRCQHRTAGYARTIVRPERGGRGWSRGGRPGKAG
eukprot:3402036-Rhodomonas_salina.1